jgi:16S rRNA (guanine966-N2)-methyltransferase
MTKGRAPQAGHPSSRGQLRIIGGRWRGRKLGFTAQPGLRPTGDRIRETLFNWLAADLPGARCADLFAGSGALGLEALSRGAAHCDFIDLSATAIRDISEHLLRLDALDSARCLAMSADAYIEQQAPRSLDIVFVDPPFGQGIAQATCRVLARSAVLSEAALIYLETGRSETLEPMAGWRTHREKVAGEVRYQLLVAP